VLHVLSPQAAGGLERAVELMAGGLVSRGHEVHALLLLDPVGEPPPIAASLEAAGVAVTTVRAPARHYWQEARAIEETLRSSRSRILHSHGYRGDVLSLRAARRAGAALVSTAHGFTGNGVRNRLYEWLDRRSLARFDAVIAVSESIRDRLIRSGAQPERVRVIENGIGPETALSCADARRALGLPAEGRLVGWIGRMTAEKGADLLVEALQPVAGRDAEVVLIGDGPERARVQGMARTGFRFLGLIPEASRYIGAFDVLVISSRTEGTPMVLLEAMQAGLPVIAFGVGGIPNVLDGSTGWLVVPEDRTGLRNAVLEALGNPAEAKMRKEAGRQRIADRFTLARWLDRVEEVYSGLD
jgi:glycosyltransferase involved in cell wall biosynthesis